MIRVLTFFTILLNFSRFIFVNNACKLIVFQILTVPRNSVPIPCRPQGLFLGFDYFGRTEGAALIIPSIYTPNLPNIVFICKLKN